MRLALQRCRPDDTLRLARFILETWIDFDTFEPDTTEMRERYQAKAQALIDTFSTPGVENKGLEDHIHRMLKEELRCIQGQQSAHTERGMLAIVAAFGDGHCVDMMERYIRNYHGNRALQAKSMLEALAQIKHPNALRVLRSLAAGFRNESIAKRASELFGEMAQAAGWTEAETAERIIPDAGFALPKELTSTGQRSPEMTLSYGPRSFLVRLNEYFQPRIELIEGLTVEELPNATAKDDRRLVRVAKAQLKSSMQVVKATELQLRERFMAAIESGRCWTVKDWRECLAEHPLASIACRRLLGAVQRPDRAALEMFQWLDSGKAVNVSGEPMELQDDWLIQLPGTAQMSADALDRWIKRFSQKKLEFFCDQFER
jgi:hypothetical protein